jgi:hypothetical protein
MHRAAEQVLSDVLQKYGSTACDTPQMLETLLRKHGRACPHEVGILTAAMRCGIVGQLRSDKTIDPESLARLLVVSAHVPQAQAEWAVAAWSAAIARAPTRVADPPEAAPQAGPRPVSAARAAAVLALAAATGVIAVFVFGR